MGDLTIKKRRYRSLLIDLLPRGWAWQVEPDSVFYLFLESLACEAARVEERGEDFLKEIDPSLTFEMIDNWERMLGIPDECTPDSYNPGLTERRLRIIQKLTTGGGQSVAFFKLIASQLGYDIDVYDILNYRDFRAGVARAGDALTNSTDPGGIPNANGWAYAFNVIAPAEFVRYFRAGRSTAGERLVFASNETLECIIRKFAPAHTVPVFSYI